MESFRKALSVEPPWNHTTPSVHQASGKDVSLGKDIITINTLIWIVSSLAICSVTSNEHIPFLSPTCRTKSNSSVSIWKQTKSSLNLQPRKRNQLFTTHALPSPSSSSHPFFILFGWTPRKLTWRSSRLKSLLLYNIISNMPINVHTRNDIMMKHYYYYFEACFKLKTIPCFISL